jgi:predicted nucleic acid-binding protein
MILVDANVWVASHDTSDVTHVESLRFLSRVLQDGLPLYAPALLLAEVGCSVARRSRSESVGRAIVMKLRSLPQLSLAPMDDAFVSDAVECGTRLLLRGADAFYAAAAERTSGELVTWDGELIQRAAGITPTAWLAANS